MTISGMGYGAWDIGCAMDRGLGRKGDASGERLADCRVVLARWLGWTLSRRDWPGKVGLEWDSDCLPCGFFYCRDKMQDLNIDGQTSNHHDQDIDHPYIHLPRHESDVSRPKTE
jgi:hypothetical protein